ncbi:MAG: hypothetical protein MZU97_17985 [Bacillus subtilis]|nr:hypothetical protein [Bacillus subtilis]
MQELSKFPRVNRDIAVVVDEAIPAGAVIDHIKAAVRKQLIDVKVFDLYRGESVGLGKKSLAIALGFQDASKTLETAEVDQLVSRFFLGFKTLSKPPSVNR